MIKNIHVGFGKLKKIVHLADVHIRLYKRHQEYRECFDTLLADLNKQDLSETVIVVAGDIVHSKTDMSPEMVSLTSYLLDSLANLAPTIVITGNHDLNLANPNRMDALSPIIDNLGNSNLHYLKHSGIYQCADVQFGVHSLLDEQSKWPVASTLTAATKIALFHGPLYNAKTDIGYTVSSRHVSVDTFAGYDMTLLGDIHKLQDMGNNVVYPGSLIQQNHGEALAGHGWLMWDVGSRTFKHHELKNNYGYVTIDLDGKLPNLNDFPKNIRLRIVTEKSDNTKIKKFISVMRKEYNVLEALVSKRKLLTGTSAKTNVTSDITDVQYQNKLITEYLQHVDATISEDVIAKVVDINTKLNSTITDEELPKNISWKPLKLKFDNLFSYGEGNHINFEDMSGLYGVFSPNATGKTSAFDALCFALYDKTPRAFKGSHIMNTRKDSCFCDLEFQIDQAVYKIVRKGERRKNGEVKVDVDFSIKDGDEWKLLNGEDRRSTNAIIRSYVGTYEDFILTNLSAQGQNSLFIDLGQSDRKDLLSQFMGLTLFDRLYTRAADESKELLGALKRFAKEDFTNAIVQHQNIIDTSTEQIHLTEHELAQTNTEYENISEDIDRLYSERIPVDEIFDTYDFEKEARDKEFYVKRVFELDTYVDEETLSININQKTIDEDLLPRLAQYDPSLLTDLSNQLNIHVKDIELIKEQKKSSSKMIDHHKQKLMLLETHEYDPNCEYCVNNQLVVDAKRSEGLLVQESQKLMELDAKELELTRAIGDIARRLLVEKELKSVADTVDMSRKAIQQSQDNISKARQQTESILDKIKQIEERQTKYVENQKAIDTNAEIAERIDILKNNRISVKTELDTLQKQLQKLHTTLTVSKNKKEEILAQIKQAEELEAMYLAYDKYMGAISRDGVPYQIISNTIPTIEAEVNNILSQMVEFNVSLQVDGKNINGFIVYDENRKWPLELASGMEKFVTGLAIRVALMSTSALPRSNFMITDEGFGALDSDKLSSIHALLNFLKDQFDFIIVISHLDSMRDMVDHMIEISRDDGFSKIQVD